MPDYGRDAFEKRRDDVSNQPDADATKVILALTPAEYDQLRKLLSSSDRLEKMITAHERAEWFWSSLGVWFKWIAGCAAALVAAKLVVSDFRDILKTWLLK